MALIDTIIQLQKQGVKDPQIIQLLKEKGVSPSDINEALNQSKIKAAVADSTQEVQDVVLDNLPGGMQPSISEQQQAPQQQQQQQQEQPAEQPQEQYQEYQPQYPEYSQDQGYSQQYSSETIAEIAEQIISEKITEIKKVITSIADFKSATDSKLSSLNERLIRIESIISDLQNSILRRVSEYGQGIDDIKEEMSMMQDSFSKVVSAAVNNAPKSKHKPSKDEEQEKPAEPEQEERREEEARGRESQRDEEKPKERRKSRDSFEHYLR